MHALPVFLDGYEQGCQVCALILERLKASISEDSPCGENVEDSDEFRLIEFEVEKETEADNIRRVGGTVDSSRLPDWTKVKSLCEELLGKTKDLRLCIYLAAACLRDGEGDLSDFRDALELAESFLGEEYRDAVHPRADPSNSKRPFWARLDAIEELGTPPATQGDAYRFVDQIRSIPLARSRQGVEFSRRDIMLIRGEIPNAKIEDANKNEAALESAFNEAVTSEKDRLVSLVTNARESATLLGSIANRVADMSGAPAPDLTELQAELAALAREVESRLGYSTEPESERGAGVAPTSSSEPSAAAPAAPPGTIQSREDVIRSIDRILDYYRAHEPSSPVPLLLKRARRFVTMGFAELVKDIAVDAVDNMKVILGEEGSTEDSE